jgi:hypothetical protein
MEGNIPRFWAGIGMTAGTMLLKVFKHEHNPNADVVENLSH